MDRLIKANTLLVPILIISIILLAYQSGINLNPPILENNINHNFFTSIISAVLYASYNTIILIPILLSLHKTISNKKQIKQIALYCIIILIILAMCILSLIWKIDIDIKSIELPTVYVVSQMGKINQYLYGFIILVSIYTSAISAGYGILENETRKSNKI